MPTASPRGEHDEPSFPRLSARTLRFTLGEPRNITVVADGSRVLFVRTAGDTDRSGALWSFDVPSATERLLADPAELLKGAEEDISQQERARRERARESGGGIVDYNVDRTGRTAVFALSGALWVCDLATARTRRIRTAGAVIDPRVDPTGRSIAYACDGALRIVGADGAGDRPLAQPDGDEIVWGQAEFVAAEEMGRSRGFWWSPDGRSLLVERYDNTPVQRWFLADPAHPDRPPRAHRYPAAGTANATVQLWHLIPDGAKRQVRWDEEAFPYLAGVCWTEPGSVIQVMSRDQRRCRVLQLDLRDGADGDEVSITVLDEQTDPAWVELIEGVPALAAGGRLLTCVDDPAEPPTRRLAVNGVPVSPPGLQVRRVRWVGEDAVVATVTDDPTEQHLARIGFDGRVELLSSGAGVHAGSAGGATVAITSARLDAVGSSVTVLHAGQEIGRLRSLAAAPPFVPEVRLLTVGERNLRVAVVLPRSHVPGSARLPVIMAPYGGPNVQLVRASLRMYLQPQWLADQGFAVVIADGRGSPGRGPAWERSVANEFAAVTLADQVDALVEVAGRYPDDLDTGRVGIMGWSYGGYLAALAVLDRPDLFHAAVAGAPVTDWTLYDTCYTERYLGRPDDQPEVYRRNSLIDRAAALRRPLMIIHGMADDNVVVAHTLRLSAALLAAGRSHQVLPLTGVTHMASAEAIAENLLLAQVDFLRRALACGAGGTFSPAG